MKYSKRALRQLLKNPGFTAVAVLMLADVWMLFSACISGDLDAVKRSLAKDSSLARSHYSYRKPLYFAVRENRLAISELLLEHDPDLFGLAVNDSLIEIARDRGYPEMERTQGNGSGRWARSGQTHYRRRR